MLPIFGSRARAPFSKFGGLVTTTRRNHPARGNRNVAAPHTNVVPPQIKLKRRALLFVALNLVCLALVIYGSRMTLNQYGEYLARYGDSAVQITVILDSAKAGKISAKEAAGKFEMLADKPGGGLAVTLGITLLQRAGEIKARDELFSKELFALPGTERRMLNKTYLDDYLNLAFGGGIYPQTSRHLPINV